jgi:hypothetical protein
MKKKTLFELLKRLENIQSPENLEIYNLNDQLTKKMLKGGYDSFNPVCEDKNASCENVACRGSNNTLCYNYSCLE